MKNIYRFKSYPISRISIAASAVLLMAGCATNPGPIAQMATSHAAVNSANTAGGAEFAPELMKSATDKINGADRAMSIKDFSRASELAEEAQVDAELASAVTGASKARAAANSAQESNKVLRNEINRKTK